MRKIMMLAMMFMVMLSVFNISFVNATTVTIAVDKIQDSGERVLAALMWVGYAVSILMMIFIGIKYILGAAESKANMKEALSGYIIGAAIVFSASTIMAIVIGLIPGAAGATAEQSASNLIDAIFSGNSTP